MPRVAVCYRQEDSRDAAARLCDRLVEELGPGRVVGDATSLEQTSGCEIVLVIIGQSWLTVAETDGRRRLDDPADTVRVQIERALADSAITIPELLGRTQMPRHEQLPPSLAQLSFQNGMQLRPDPDFHRDIARLLKAIRNNALLPSTPPLARAHLIKALARGRNGGIAGALLALVCVLFCFEINPRLPDEVLVILFAAWPLGWFLVWWQMRMPRVALLAFLLLLITIIVDIISLFMSFVFFIFPFFILRIRGLLNDELMINSISCLSCAFTGAMVGAVFGASTSAKSLEANPAVDAALSRPRRTLSWGIVFGSLLGFVFSSVLCEVMYVLHPTVPNVTNSLKYTTDFVFAILEPLVILWMTLGFVAATLSRTKRRSGS